MRNIRRKFSGKNGKAKTGFSYNRMGRAVAMLALTGIFSLAIARENGGLRYVEAYERTAYVFNSEDEQDSVTKVINIQSEVESEVQTEVQTEVQSDEAKETEIHLEEYTPFLEPSVFLSKNSEEVKKKQQEIVEQQVAEAQAEKEAEEALKKAEAIEEAKRVTEEKNQVKIQLSNQDKRVLQRIVEAEATGEDIRGKMLVANVVLNRVNKKNEFPDNVTDVVFERSSGVYQFSPIQDGRYWSVKITDETKEAVERVLRGEDLSEGALYFMARKYADPDNVVWFDRSLTWLFAYGEHEFYR